jgi:hypothetical protein
MTDTILYVDIDTAETDARTRGSSSSCVIAVPS